MPMREVIFCKNCTYSKRYGDRLVCELYAEDGFDFTVGEDEFCSRAETVEEQYQQELREEREQCRK